MRSYYFNARDVAAYFKYFSVPSYLEVSYMQYVFNLGKRVLAEPLTRDFEQFKREVYRELYFLWSNGFDSERSDISAMVTEGQVSFICDQECINLESYMKLICLHLIFSGNLPYVNLNFAGLMLTLGIKCEEEVYEQNVRMVLEPLRLNVSDCFGKPFDLGRGVPDELLRIYLDSEFKDSLSSRDFRESLRVQQMAWLKELKDKSFKLFGTIPARKKPSYSKKTSSKRSGGYRPDGDGQVRGGKNQPKGSPKAGKNKNNSTWRI